MGKKKGRKGTREDKRLEKRRGEERRGKGREGRDYRRGERTFALQRRGEVGVIVTITTGGPVAMETGGSGGWARDEREHTHTNTQLGYIHLHVYTHTNTQTNMQTGAR